MANKYGKLDNPTDVTSINTKIRVKIKTAKTRDAIRTLVAESRYLWTLSFSDGVKKSIHGKTDKVRKRIKSEFTKTANAANSRLKVIKSKGSSFKTTI